jgi:hypothetical protein
MNEKEEIRREYERLEFARKDPNLFLLDQIELRLRNGILWIKLVGFALIVLLALILWRLWPLGT